MKACSVDGCTAKYYAKGYCYKHWQRIRKHGSPDDNANTHGSLEARFWRKVDKTGDCWEWTGNKKPVGYGAIQEGGKGSKSLLAHRVSYQIHKGEIPDGMVVMHSCDNRGCVNPDHLSIGTYSENTLDAIQKGRFPCNLPEPKSGATHRLAISIEKAKAIKGAEGTQTELSRAFAVDRTVVRAIKNGTHWSCR